MPKIYTRRGDSGTTELADGRRVEKTDKQVETYGTIDELIAHLGLLCVDLNDNDDQAFVIQTQRHLFGIGAWIAGAKKPTNFPTQADIDSMERWIDNAEQEIGHGFKSFIIPGGTRGAAQAHVARTVARRAERCLCAICPQLPPIATENPQKTVEIALSYFNRLSDFLFTLAIKINFLCQRDEIKL